MPTNLPMACKAQYNKVLQAGSPKEKLRELEKFYSMIPKHKGTEKLRMHVRRQIASLKAQIEEAKRRRASTASYSWMVEKHGAAQMVLLGFTKTGKSSLLARLTNARPLVASYPYATVEPEVGMLAYEDIQFQLVEAPSLKPDPEASWNLKPLTLARNSDGLLLTVNLANQPEAQLEAALQRLEAAKISVKKPKGRVVVDSNTLVSGVQLVGSLSDATLEDVRRLLAQYGVTRAVVKVYGEACLDDVEDALFEGLVYRPTLVLASKADLAGESEVEDLKEYCRKLSLPVLPVSAETGLNLNRVGELIYHSLGLIRVYTKPPHAEKPSPKPFTLRKGATILELARQIHKSLAEKFRYAKVWHGNSRAPIRVGEEYVLQEGDIVEIRGK